MSRMAHVLDHHGFHVIRTQGG